MPPPCAACLHAPALSSALVPTPLPCSTPRLCFQHNKAAQAVGVAGAGGAVLWERDQGKSKDGELPPFQQPQQFEVEPHSEMAPVRDYNGTYGGGAPAGAIAHA